MGSSWVRLTLVHRSALHLPAVAGLWTCRPYGAGDGHCDGHCGAQSKDLGKMLQAPACGFPARRGSLRVVIPRASGPSGSCTRGGPSVTRPRPATWLGVPWGSQPPLTHRPHVLCAWKVCVACLSSGLQSRPLWLLAAHCRAPQAGGVPCSPGHPLPLPGQEPVSTCVGLLTVTVPVLLQGAA